MKLAKETMEEITEYDLDVDESITDHDAACVEQAGRLLKIGYLEYETAVYATSYRLNNERYYYMAEKVHNVEKYQQKLLEQNIYATPIRYFSKRYDLIRDSEEEIKKKFRYEVALTMDADYPEIFFEGIENLTASLNTNQAYGLVKNLLEQIEDSFDEDQLILLSGLLPMLRKARLLNNEAYELAKQWLNREQEKNVLEILDYGYYRRSYYGFAYCNKQGMTKYFIDALRYRAYERQTELLSQGYIVTPVFSKVYFRDSYQALNGCRSLFAKSLENCTGEKYLTLMGMFKQLPASVDEELYYEYALKIEATESPRAMMDWQYFGQLWQVRAK